MTKISERMPIHIIGFENMGILKAERVVERIVNKLPICVKTTAAKAMAVAER